MGIKNSLSSQAAIEYKNQQDWLEIKKSTPVRVQWDPERDIYSQPLRYRTIQIGLSNEAVMLYINEWIKSITDVTNTASEICNLISQRDLDNATKKLPIERPYNISRGARFTVDLSEY